MISEEQFVTELNLIISNAVREDVGDGDHSSLACIPDTATGRAQLLVKDTGIIAGVEFARKVFRYIDRDLEMEVLIEDGSSVKFGDVVFVVKECPEVFHSFRSGNGGFRLNIQKAVACHHASGSHTDQCLGYCFFDCNFHLDGFEVKM